MGEPRMAIVRKQVVRVWYALCLSAFISPFQNRRRLKRTCQLLSSSTTKS